MNKNSTSMRLKTILALVWFVFTFSLVAWWLIFTLSRTDLAQSTHRMFLWEGAILLGAVLLGGGIMVYLTYRDEKRHQRMRFFFATFSHDIKTSISRLRLQAEVLQEDLSHLQNPVLSRLLQDILRLDMQLENSLMLSNITDRSLFVEKVKLSQLMAYLRSDFVDLTIELTHDVEILVDKKAFLSVLRNLFQNSILHGKANNIRIQVDSHKSQVILLIKDNGLGYKGTLAQLGAEMLNSQNANGNGIGLYISRRLIEKMKGQLCFESNNEGFVCRLNIPGRIL